MKTITHLKKTRLALQLVPAMAILVALAISIPASAQTVTTFDAPGAGTGAFQGTYAFNIHPSGAIIGFTRDANNARHGFIRSQQGNFFLFDVPGAGTSAGQGTVSYAISPGGWITGYYLDGADVSHGFLRDRNGVITTFDVPGSGTDPFLGTLSRRLFSERNHHGKLLRQRHPKSRFPAR